MLIIIYVKIYFKKIFFFKLELGSISRTNNLYKDRYAKEKKKKIFKVKSISKGN